MLFFLSPASAGNCKGLSKDHSALHICRHRKFHNPEHKVTQCKNSVLSISLRYLDSGFPEDQSDIEADLCLLAEEPFTKAQLLFSFFPPVIVVLFVTLRRHKNEPLIIKDDEDVRENIIRYDDEGGGEEDTEAFDIATLQNPDGINGYLPRKDIKPDLQFMPRAGQHSGPNGVDVDEFINVRLHEADNDPTAPPYDSIQIYGYEGRGSIAGSLSSLETTSSDSDQNYDYLREWGPRFRRLGELYSVGESDRET